jgi:hypothetical protein
MVFCLLCVSFFALAGKNDIDERNFSLVTFVILSSALKITPWQHQNLSLKIRDAPWFASKRLAPAVLYIDLQLIHEVISAAFQMPAPADGAPTDKDLTSGRVDRASAITLRGGWLCIAARDWAQGSSSLRSLRRTAPSSAFRCSSWATIARASACDRAGAG